MAFVDPEQDPRKGLPVLGAPMPRPEAAPGGAPGAPGGGVGAPMAPAPAAAHGGTGYVNLSRYIGANQGAAQGMANAIGGDVAQMGTQAMSDAGKYQGQLHGSSVDPTLQAKVGQEAAQATMGAQALQSPGGIGALLTQHYGAGGGYGGGMRGFDTFLTGSAGGGQFQQLGNQYGGLDKYVSGLTSTAPLGPATAGGIHNGPAGKSPPGMVRSSPLPQGGGPSTPVGGGGEPGGAGDRRKRRMA